MFIYTVPVYLFYRECRVELVRTERIIIAPSHPNHAACKRYCLAARRVYNSALYQMRQALFSGEPINDRKADKILKQQFRQIYEFLPAAGSQRTTQILGDAWRSWQNAKKDFEQHPQKYKAKPRLPNYSKSAKTYTVGRNGFRIIGGYLKLSGDFGFQPLQVTCCTNQPFNCAKEHTRVLDVRIVPLGSAFVVELIYREFVETCETLNPENVIGIDLGIDNLVAITSNQQGFTPVLIRGKVIKSINAKYNKLKAELASKGKHRHIKSKVRKRYCQINDYFHKVSHWIINTCLETNTGKIVIGLNPEWKQEINIGKVNNQKFVSIPHRRLIDMVTYKAERYSIVVVVREESYTSKASCLDLDVMPTYEGVKSGAETEPAFSGKRRHRGLYLTATGKAIHADVNGSGNILRKEIGDEWVQNHLKANQGIVDMPRVVKHIDQLLEGSLRAIETTSKRFAA